jgi:hypothetical protein
VAILDAPDKKIKIEIKIKISKITKLFYEY